ncbi:MAG: AraC family transcriptional regulator [Mycobacterium leprae]
MQLLTGQRILDPETQAHIACHRSIKLMREPHFHDFYEFFLVNQGELYHMINGQRALLAAGSLMLIRPHDRHYYEQHGEAGCELINLAFATETFDDLLQYLGQGPLSAGLLADPIPPCHPLSPDELVTVAERLKGLTRSVTDKGRLRAEIRAVLADLFVRYFMPRRATPQTDSPAWLTGLMREMRKQENFTLGLPRLHELAPVSPEHLCRSMKKHLGQTPTDWLNDLKLHYAADLLAHSDEEIVAVALQAGFSNLSHFYHLFGQRFGASPGEFRKGRRM